MNKIVRLAIKGESITGTINGFLKDLMEKGIVDTILVPVELPDKTNVVQALIDDPESLIKAEPLAPVMPVHSARLISRMTMVTPSSQKLAVIIRPCEARATVELLKLNQLSLENISIISMDCYGTYSVKDYEEYAKSCENPGDTFIKQSRKTSQENGKLRWNCKTCMYPVPLYSDITIGIAGAEPDKEILLISNTARGEEIVSSTGLEITDSSDSRKAAESQFIKQRVSFRESVLDQTLNEIKGVENMLRVFGKCIKCHNCMTACPICYCKECFFNSPTFEIEAERYLDLAATKGIMRMPTDTLLFHLTRMSHMSSSCVSCGLCTEACPNDIPVGKIFSIVGTNAQKMFNYIPGRDKGEDLPLSTFKEQELVEMED